MTVQETYIDTLKSALWGTELQTIIDKDTVERVLRLAKKQATGPMVANVLATSRKSDATLEQRGRIQILLRRCFSSNLLINQVGAMVYSALKDSGVCPILLKGNGIASYYPVPYLRECGDIDLYIGEADYSKAVGIVTSLASEEARNAAKTSAKHYCIKINDVTVELHRTTEVLPPEYDIIFQKYTREALEERPPEMVQISGFITGTPPDSYNAFYIFYHIWHHYMTSGIGMRQVCDLAVFLHAKAGSLDNDYLSRVLTDLDVLEPWQVMGRILVGKLGLPAEEMPLYVSDGTEKEARQTEKAFRILINEGNFGHLHQVQETRPKAYLAGKIHSFLSNYIRYRKLNRIFSTNAINAQMKMMIHSGIRAL